MSGEPCSIVRLCVPDIFAVGPSNVGPSPDTSLGPTASELCGEEPPFLVINTYFLALAKPSIGTGHAMQIYNCLNCPRQL